MEEIIYVKDNNSFCTKSLQALLQSNVGASSATL